MNTVKAILVIIGIGILVSMMQDGKVFAIKIVTAFSIGLLFGITIASEIVSYSRRKEEAEESANIRPLSETELNEICNGK